MRTARKAQTKAVRKKPSKRKSAGKPIPSNVEQHFKAGVLARGEAAVLKDGELPPGKTHAIVGHDEKGEPIIQRRRFALA